MDDELLKKLEKRRGVLRKQELAARGQTGDGKSEAHRSLPVPVARSSGTERTLSGLSASSQHRQPPHPQRPPPLRRSSGGNHPPPPRRRSSDGNRPPPPPPPRPLQSSKSEKKVALPPPPPRPLPRPNSVPNAERRLPLPVAKISPIKTDSKRSEASCASSCSSLPSNGSFPLPPPPPPPPPRPAKASPTNTVKAKRGPADFRKPRPSSVPHQKGSVAAAGSFREGSGQPNSLNRDPDANFRPTSTSGVNGVPKRSISLSAASADMFSRTTPSNNVLRAATMNAETSTLVRKNSASNFSDKQRLEFAKQGKAMFNETISNSKSTPITAKQVSSPTTAEPVKYARVDEFFDPVGQGFSEHEYLAVSEGDVVEVLEQIDRKWWKGQIWDPIRGKGVGALGKFPCGRVVPIVDPTDPWCEGDPEEELRWAQEAAAKVDEEHHKKWRNRNRLFFALLEILTNEFKYVRSLMIGFEVFIKGISKKFGSEYVGALFPSWHLMMETHYGVLLALANCSRMSWSKLQELVPLSDTLSASTKPLSGALELEKGMGGLKRASKDMLGIAKDLDAIKRWHDICILDKEKELSDDVFEAYTVLLAEWTTMLCSTLTKESVHLVVSSVYICNYNSAVNNLQSWSKVLAGFQELVTKLSAQAVADGLDLASFLIKPIQHICRYPLLIREVLKYVPASHVEADVSQCQAELIKVTTGLNAVQTGFSEDNGPRITLEELKGALSLKHVSPQERSACLDWVQKVTAQIIKQGELSVSRVPDGYAFRGKKDMYTCFVLDSLFIVTESVVKFRVAHKLTVRAVFYSGNIKAAPIETTKFALQVKASKTNKSEWTFQASSASERDMWVRAIQLARSIKLSVPVGSKKSPARSTGGKAPGNVEGRRSSPAPVPSDPEVDLGRIQLLPAYIDELSERIGGNSIQR